MCVRVCVGEDGAGGYYWLTLLSPDISISNYPGSCGLTYEDIMYSTAGTLQWPMPALHLDVEVS